MNKTIQEIYNQYKVMPSLQLHMFRVTAVAKVICDNRQWKEFNKEATIVSCYLHDIWNIIKFDLSLYPEFLEPEGIEYWQSVKDDYKTYWSTEYEATVSIAKEIWISDEAFTILYSQVMEPFAKNITSNNFWLRVCEYADLCVTPHWIVSPRERVIDLENRDMKNHNYSKEVAQEKTKARLEWVMFLEESLLTGFPDIKSIPTLIDESSIYDLWKYII